MTRFVDSLIAYRILRMLTTAFEDTDAYRLGIIDKKGKELKKMSQLNSADEKDAYSILHRMVFRIKRIIEKVPVDNKKLASFTAALALIKEHYDTKSEPIDLEMQYLDKLQEQLSEEDIIITKKFLNEKYTLTFKQFWEEAPANNASATPGIAGFTPDTIGVKPKKRKPRVLRRSEL